MSAQETIEKGHKRRPHRLLAKAIKWVELNHDGKHDTWDQWEALDDEFQKDGINPAEVAAEHIPALLAACEAAAEVLDVALGDNQIHADSDDGRDAVRALKALREAISLATGEPVTNNATEEEGAA